MKRLALLLSFFALTARADCPASATAFTGARYDAPFFVFDGAGSPGDGFGQFDHPTAIAEIGNGMVAISDTGNDRIKTVTLEGFFQDFWGLDRPGAIAPVGDGTVWAIDGKNRTAERLQAFEELVESVTGTFLMGAGNFENPAGVAVDSSGRLFVVDAGRKRIQVFSAKGKALKSIGGDALFTEPYGIVLDRADTLYVTDSARNRIVKLDTSGKVLAAFGEDELKTPRGLAVRDGFLYVADSGNARIAKFDVNGKFIASAGCRGTDAGEFLEPVSVAIDAERHLYVVDRAAHRVLKLGHQ